MSLDLSWCVPHEKGGEDAAQLGAALNALEQEHAILEAAVTSAIAHPNVVSDDTCKKKAYVNDDSHLRYFHPKKRSLSVLFNSRSTSTSNE